MFIQFDWSEKYRDTLKEHHVTKKGRVQCYTTMDQWMLQISFKYWKLTKQEITKHSFKGSRESSPANTVSPETETNKFLF